MNISSSAIEKSLAKIQDKALRQEFGAIITALLEQNKLLEERIALLERELFGSKSEKHKPTGEEQSGTDLTLLFDTQECDEITVGQTKETITYTRNRPSRDKSARF